MEPLEEDKKYDLNVGRHKRHGKSAAWAFVVKIAIGVSLIFLVYYITTLINEKAAKQEEKNQEVEVEIEMP